MRVLVIASTLAVACLATPAEAQEAREVAPADLERARTLFEQGRAAYESGDFETALEAFREAHALTENADLLYNVASAADRLRRDEVALEAYRGYLEARPDSSDRAQVEGRIRVLEAQLARREEERARLEAERDEATAATEATPPLHASAEPADTTTTAPAESEPGAAPWIVVGVGGAFLIGGVITLVIAEIDAACVEEPSGCVAQADAPRWGEVSDRYDRVPALRGVGGALAGVGIAAAAVGLVWGLASGGDDDAEVRASLGPGGVVVEGRF
ncbi:MAG TPA: tetratricopeptide repeat protein [Sandaracinaceae bacterium LLY-WYZ-13_1]|nr:tetratricopeptide repeat protein [Sandaracinaceae bacterium LLY-WYZ-13_1]